MADFRRRPIYDIGLFRSSTKDKNTQLNVFVSNKRFKIDLLAVNFESSPTLLEEYLRQVKRQEPEYIPDINEEVEFDDPLEEIRDWILQPFLPIFHSLPSLDLGRKYTLENCLFSEEFHYTVKAVGGNLVPVFLEKTDSKKNHLVGAILPSSSHVDYSAFPVYHPSEIHVPVNAESTSLPSIPRKVFIRGQSSPSFFNIVYGGDAGITVRELHAYSKIHAAQFDVTVLTSRLHGLVQDHDGHVMGLLLSFIDCRGVTLSCIDTHNPKYSNLGQKWFSQISLSLKHLHSRGIAWGDAKAANVLIDVNQDAYLIDFGGGYTEGWVERDKCNSIAGDLQGLEKIKQHFFTN